MKNKENIIYPKFVQDFLDMMKINKHHSNFMLTLSEEEMKLMEQIRVPFSHEVGFIIGNSKMDMDLSCYGGGILKIKKIK